MLIRAHIAVVEELSFCLARKGRARHTATLRQRELGAFCNHFRGAHNDILVKKQSKLKLNPADAEIRGQRSEVRG